MEAHEHGPPRAGASRDDRAPAASGDAPADPAPEVAPAVVAPDRLATLPNLLSAVRLAATPVFVALFVTGREEAAVILYGAAAWTDFFDGYIARRTNSISELGKLLDPLSDRLLILALTIALVARGVLAWWLAAAVIVRDVLVLSLFPLFDRRGLGRIPVNFTGKLATACLLLGLTLLAWSATSFPLERPARGIGLAFASAGAVFYWAAAVLYARAVWARLRPKEGDART
ncbi:MAG TPA: CDP-alcohol phosphatidyltransferase family protein [Actinomycetota bacterium]|nr:CDP-alcohol phosphatidyltransferase family protein [Actinomycetota bacterium]